MKHLRYSVSGQVAAIGMIGGGAALLEDLHVAAGLLGHAQEHVEEVLARDVAGAATGDEDPARLQQLHAQAIEMVVRPQGVVQAAAAVSEPGRVEDQAAELLAGRSQRLQHLEAVGRLETHVRQAVEPGVGLGQGHGAAAGIDAQHFAGAAGGRADRAKPPL